MHAPVPAVRAWLRSRARRGGAPTPARLRVGAALALVAVLGLAEAPAALAQSEAGTGPDDPVYAVSHFVLLYEEEHPDHPPPAALLPLDVRLARRGGAFSAPREGEPTEVVRITGEPTEPARAFHASALGLVAEALLAELHERDLLGVYVSPHPSDIDPDSERDLRRPGDTTLRLLISTARVRELRTLALGERIEGSWRVNHRLHRRIREGSPIQPTEVAGDGSTDLLRRDLLEDYLFRLNRHPGRHVEAALAPASEGPGIALDYRINESRPWFVYAQLSNTGSEETNEWQQRYGFVHRQLTNRDDILSLEYLNSGFDEVNAITASYEAPWFGSRRPGWFRSSPGEPDWLGPLRRDRLPWFGWDRLRWGLQGAVSRTKIDNLAGIPGEDLRFEEWMLGGRMTLSAFQHGPFFLDAFAAFRARNVSVKNEGFGSDADQLLLLPGVGLEVERVTEVSTLFGTLTFERNVSNIDAGAEFLGRPHVADQYQLLRADLGFTHFLEPLLFPNAFLDPSTRATSTLAHELAFGARGQYAFGDRLIPQLSQVVGGLYSVRGYPESAAPGDTIYVGSAEYRFHIPWGLPARRDPIRLPALGDFRATPQHAYGRADWDLILRAFFDAGRVVRYDANDGFSPGEFSQTLMGAGVGLELRVRHNLRARVDWAQALKSTKDGRVDSGDRELHFLFTILY